MYICFTNHQPKDDTGYEDHLPQNPLALLFGPGKLSLGKGSHGDEFSKMMESEIPAETAGKKKPRRKISPEIPKDGAPIYLNIEKDDVLALVPMRYGGTQITYLSPVSSAELPEAMGGQTLHQKSRMTVLVKESPSNVAKRLGIIAQGA